MKGDLQDFHLSDLVRTCCQHPVDVRLIVASPAGTGTIHFSVGEVFHAETGESTGKPALLEILGWRSGLFELQRDVPPPRRSIQEPWTALVRQAPGGNAHLVRHLRGIPGVEAALVSGWNGEVLAEEGTEQPEALAALATFIGSAARQVGAPLGLGTFRRAVVQVGPRRHLLLRCGDSWAGVRLAEGARPEQVCSDARPLIGEA